MLLTSKKSWLFKWGSAGVVCLAVVCCVTFAYSRWQNSHSEHLKELLASLTYSHDMRSVEAQRLSDFKELSLLTDYEKASFYMAQTRIYSMVLGSDMQAMEAFTSGVICAERSRNFEAAAWLHVDFAQIFVKNSSWEPAIECLKRSLEYAAETKMNDQYYAYCYSLLAFAYSSIDQNNVRVVKQYYEQADLYRNTAFYKDYPIDILLDMTLAQINLRERSYIDCKNNLSKVKRYIDSCSFDTSLLDMYNRPYPPWISRYVLPYYRTAAILAVRQGRIDDTLQFVQEGYGMLSASYKETNFIMRFFSGVFPEVLSSENMDSDTYRELVKFTVDAAVDYSLMMEINENEVGKSMYQTSKTAVERSQKEFYMTRLYQIILFLLILSGAVIGAMAAIVFLLRRHANFDSVTGAYNRGSFDRHYLAACQKKEPFGVILYDIDYFKQFNDTYGHAYGDLVLKRTAAIASSKLNRHHCTLYRYGGDEFVAICRKCTPESLLALAKDLEEEVKKIIFDADVSVTLSIGISHSTLTDNVLGAADENLYAAKKCGRACVRSSVE